MLLNYVVLFCFLYTEGRPEVPRITIVLTGGRQAPSSDLNALRLASKALKETGSNTYIIAIDKEQKTSHLLPIVQQPEHMFTVKKFDELQRDLDSTARNIARTSGKQILLSFITAIVLSRAFIYKKVGLSSANNIRYLSCSNECVNQLLLLPEGTLNLSILLSRSHLGYDYSPSSNIIGFSSSNSIFNSLVPPRRSKDFNP